jgi:hypothetical protein
MGDEGGQSTGIWPGGWTGRRLAIVALPVVAVVALVAFLLLRGDDDATVRTASSDNLPTIPPGASTTASTGVPVPSTEPASTASTVPGGPVDTTLATVDPTVTTAASTGRPGARIQVKFSDGTGVRLRDGGFVSTTGQDLGALQAVLTRYPVVGIDRLFQRPEEDLAAEKAANETRTGQPQPDLNLYFRVTLTEGVDAAAFITELEGLAVVGSAYNDPVAAPPPSPGR